MIENGAKGTNPADNPNPPEGGFFYSTLTHCDPSVSVIVSYVIAVMRLRRGQRPGAHVGGIFSNFGTKGSRWSQA